MRIKNVYLIAEVELGGQKDHRVFGLVIKAVEPVSIYNVTFYVNNTIYGDIQQIEKGKSALEPETPVLQGHTFVNWDKALTNIQADTDIHAVFSINKYQITFKVDGQPNKVVTYPYQDNITKPVDPTKLNHKFLGWSETIPNIMPSQNLEFTALFKDLLEAINEAATKVEIKTALEDVDLEIDDTTFALLKELNKDKVYQDMLDNRPDGGYTSVLDVQTLFKDFSDTYVVIETVLDAFNQATLPSDINPTELLTSLKTQLNNTNIPTLDSNQTSALSTLIDDIIEDYNALNNEAMKNRVIESIIEKNYDSVKDLLDALESEQPLKLVNDADNTNIKAAIENVNLGLDLTQYNDLTPEMQVKVLADIIANRATEGFESKEQLQDLLNDLINSYQTQIDMVDLVNESTVGDDLSSVGIIEDIIDELTNSNFEIIDGQAKADIISDLEAVSTSIDGLNETAKKALLEEIVENKPYSNYDELVEKIKDIITDLTSIERTLTIKVLNQADQLYTYKVGGVYVAGTTTQKSTLTIDETSSFLEGFQITGSAEEQTSVEVVLPVDYKKHYHISKTVETKDIKAIWINREIEDIPDFAPISIDVSGKIYLFQNTAQINSNDSNAYDLLKGRVAQLYNRDYNYEFGIKYGVTVQGMEATNLTKGLNFVAYNDLMILKLKNLTVSNTSKLLFTRSQGQNHGYKNITFEDVKFINITGLIKVEYLNYSTSNQNAHVRFINTTKDGVKVQYKDIDFKKVNKPPSSTQIMVFYNEAGMRIDNKPTTELDLVYYEIRTSIVFKYHIEDEAYGHTFSLAKGKPLDPLPPEPQNPRPGYKIVWTEKETGEGLPDTAEKNMDFLGTFVPIDYTITYILDGGENHPDNPEAYTIESPTITLNTPTKTGYVFRGWYSDEAFTSPITEITLGSTGNQILYAKFEAE